MQDKPLLPSKQSPPMELRGWWKSSLLHRKLAGNIQNLSSPIFVPFHLLSYIDCQMKASFFIHLVSFIDYPLSNELICQGWGGADNSLYPLSYIPYPSYICCSTFIIQYPKSVIQYLLSLTHSNELNWQGWGGADNFLHEPLQPRARLAV